MPKHNENPDVPTFDVGESGRVDLTLFKMDTGFLLKDNTLKKDHSISKIEDLEASLALVIESSKEKIRSLMQARSKFDYIDIAIIIQEGEDEGDMYQIDDTNVPETLNLEPEQLAMLVNNIIADNPIAGYPSRRGFRGDGPVVITGNDIVRAFNSPRNIIAMKTRVGDPDPRGRRIDKTENLKHKKHFFDKTKNRPPEEKKKDGGDGKPTEIR